MSLCEKIKRFVCCCFNKPDKAEGDTSFKYRISEVKKGQISSFNSHQVIDQKNIEPYVDLPSLPRLPESSDKIKLTIQTVKNQLKELTISKNATGAQLKQLIFDQVCQSLDARDMSLSYEGTVIGNKKKLSELRVLVGSQLKIVQAKIPIGEVPGIIADVNAIDVISEEKGTAKMSCGHGIGRDTMTAMVRSLISTEKYEIRCPYPGVNRQTCDALWEFKDCRRVGVFTREEVEEFETGLSVNMIKKHTKACPNPSCGQQISKIDLKTNRVRCPSCKYGDFCYICLKTWTGSDSDFCGSEECRFMYTMLGNCPWNHFLKMKDKNNNNVQKLFATPTYRACPHCNMVYEHVRGCKHMKCLACNVNFCWVCLSVAGNNGWQCGSFEDYCGKVAPTQSILPK